MSWLSTFMSVITRSGAASAELTDDVDCAGTEASSFRRETRSMLSMIARKRFCQRSPDPYLHCNDPLLNLPHLNRQTIVIIITLDDFSSGLIEQSFHFGWVAQKGKFSLPCFPCSQVLVLYIIVHLQVQINMTHDPTSSGTSTDVDIFTLSEQMHHLIQRACLMLGLLVVALNLGGVLHKINFRYFRETALFVSIGKGILRRM